MFSSAVVYSRCHWQVLFQLLIDISQGNWESVGIWTFKLID